MKLLSTTSSVMLLYQLPQTTVRERLQSRRHPAKYPSMDSKTKYSKCRPIYRRSVRASVVEIPCVLYSFWGGVSDEADEAYEELVGKSRGCTDRMICTAYVRASGMLR